MPQFDLANATVDANFIDTMIYPDEGFVPYIYDDRYPLVITKETAEGMSPPMDDKLFDSTNSAKGIWYHKEDAYNTSDFTVGSDEYKRFKNYRHSNTGVSGSRVPYNPTIHGKPDGTLTVGMGATIHPYGMTSDEFFNNFYTNGIDINGTTYKFPASFDQALVNNNGGYWLDNNGTLVTGKDLPFKYTGDDSNNNNQRFSYAHARQQALWLCTRTGGYVDAVKSAMTGYEDTFPYNNTLAQLHFEIMVATAYHRGGNGFSKGLFAHFYKQTKL